MSDPLARRRQAYERYLLDLTTAWNPGKTKILHSHSPPADTG